MIGSTARQRDLISPSAHVVTSKPRQRSRLIREAGGWSSFGHLAGEFYKLFRGVTADGRQASA